jgi:hypothetical protein
MIAMLGINALRRYSAPLVAASIAFTAIALMKTPSTGAECLPGYELRDPVELASELRERPVGAAEAAGLRAQFGERACFARGVQRLAEARERKAARAELALSAPVDLAAAVQQKETLRSKQTLIKNAAGRWTPYGKGTPQGDPEYPGGIATLGISNLSGLVADLEFDPEHRRLFAAVSAGGVWMSEAQDGDLGTLGDLWVDIGRQLPTQATAHVSWSAAGGGTLLVLTGEHTLDGGSFTSLGVYWSTDLGQSWNAAAGMEGAYGGPAFHMAVDPGNPEIVYAATGRGLWRSTDAGRSFVNVALPTGVSGECAGVTDIRSACFLANMVTDVVVQTPGGLGRPVNCGGGTPCPVLAAVGWPDGAAPYADGVPQSPSNGLYKSATGEPGSFAKLDLLPAPPPAEVPAGVIPVGFAPQHQIGRVELAAATGPGQDHNFVYAIVDDALLERGGLPVIDVDDPGVADTCNLLVGGNDPTGLVCPVVNGVTHATAFNGIYVSPDFGETWVRLTDEIETTYNPFAGSALNPVFLLLAGYGPGVQASYNLSLAVDPTSASLLPPGLIPDAADVPVPTRVVFGLEEVFASRLPVPLGGVPGTQTGPTSDFVVIGEYFAGDLCYAFLALPACPQQPTTPVPNTTTHPDQHDALFVPDENGGVWLFVANDGGVFRQYSSGPTDPFDNASWSDGLAEGQNTLLIYGFGVAKDGTVYAGLQDNGSIKIEPGEDGNGGRMISTGGGDGVYSQVDPDFSDFAFQQTPGLALSVTFDGGRSFQRLTPPAGVAHFTSPYMLDPADTQHVVAAGSAVAVSVEGGAAGTAYQQVFNLGVDEASGAPHQSRLRAIDVQDGAIYVGWCGPCVPALQGFPFQRGLATNVTVAGKPAVKGTEEGWHQASLNGLPRRYIHAVESDPAEPRTVFVGLGNYSTARYLPTGTYLDTNDAVGRGRVFKSTDAGENFVDITGDLPDTIVTSLLVVGDQLIAGTDIGAFISSDLNGSSWTVLGDLPAVAVNQLVLDPANSSRVFAGTYGRGLWTYTLSDTPALPSAPTVPAPGTPQPEEADRDRFGGSGGLALLLLVLPALLRRRV